MKLLNFVLLASAVGAIHADQSGFGGAESISTVGQQPNDGTLVAEKKQLIKAEQLKDEKSKFEKVLEYLEELSRQLGTLHDTATEFLKSLPKDILKSKLEGKDTQDKESVSDLLTDVAKDIEDMAKEYNSFEETLDRFWDQGNTKMMEVGLKSIKTFLEYDPSTSIDDVYSALILLNKQFDKTQSEDDKSKAEKMYSFSKDLNDLQITKDKISKVLENLEVGEISQLEEDLFDNFTTIHKLQTELDGLKEIIPSSNQLMADGMNIQLTFKGNWLGLISTCEMNPFEKYTTSQGIKEGKMEFLNRNIIQPYLRLYNDFVSAGKLIAPTEYARLKPITLNWSEYVEGSQKHLEKYLKAHKKSKVGIYQDLMAEDDKEGLKVGD